VLNLYGQSSSRDFTDTLGELGAGGFRILAIIIPLCCYVLYFDNGMYIQVCNSKQVIFYSFRCEIRVTLMM